MSFSVTTNIFLRSAYGLNRNYLDKKERQTASCDMLADIDSKALQKSIKSLESSTFDDREDATETNGKVKDFAKKMKTFIDTYNYTYDSASKSGDKDLKKAASSMLSLVKKYKDQLEKAGISADSSGYLKLSSSARIKTTGYFEELFGKDSKFLQELNKIPRRIQNHIDLSV